MTDPVKSPARELGVQTQVLFTKPDSVEAKLGWQVDQTYHYQTKVLGTLTFTSFIRKLPS